MGTGEIGRASHCHVDASRCVEARPSPRTRRTSAPTARPAHARHKKGGSRRTVHPPKPGLAAIQLDLSSPDPKPFLPAICDQTMGPTIGKLNLAVRFRHDGRDFEEGGKPRSPDRVIDDIIYSATGGPNVSRSDYVAEVQSGRCIGVSFSGQDPAQNYIYWTLLSAQANKLIPTLIAFSDGDWAAKEIGRNLLLADAADYVRGDRPVAGSKSTGRPSKEEQFARLEFLIYELKAINPQLFAQMVKKCAEAIHVTSDEAMLKKLQSVVKKMQQGRIQNVPLNQWITDRM